MPTLAAWIRGCEAPHAYAVSEACLLAGPGRPGRCGAAAGPSLPRAVVRAPAAGQRGERSRGAAVRRGQRPRLRAGRLLDDPLSRHRLHFGWLIPWGLPRARPHAGSQGARSCVKGLARGVTGMHATNGMCPRPCTQNPRSTLPVLAGRQTCMPRADH